ncbi:MAG: peptidoglycan-binding protein, partial [Acidobacteriota bacterium]|nr:peptidoglycan-binding protein [Acidobacteriota bacterium]
MPLNLTKLDKADARLVQAGLKSFGLYDGSLLGVPAAKTKAAYKRYLATLEDPVEHFEPNLDAQLNYPASVRKEFEFPGEIKEGTKGRKARQVQEWVSIHGFKTGIDEEFGPATKRALKLFQEARGITVTGKVNKSTWAELVAPMNRAFASVAPAATLSETVLRVAGQHLREHPIELGGANCGPWVRAYMNGNQGAPWMWCAGFVTFVMKQAAKIQKASTPIDGSFSCDILAGQAKDKKKFVSERDLNNKKVKWSESGL